MMLKRTIRGRRFWRNNSIREKRKRGNQVKRENSNRKRRVKKRGGRSKRTGSEITGLRGGKKKIPEFNPKTETSEREKRNQQEGIFHPTKEPLQTCGREKGERRMMV